MIQPTKNIETYDLSFNRAIPQFHVFIYFLPHYMGHNRDTIVGNTGRHATNVPIMNLTDSFCFISLFFVPCNYPTTCTKPQNSLTHLTPNFCSAIILPAFSEWISVRSQHTQATEVAASVNESSRPFFRSTQTVLQQVNFPNQGGGFSRRESALGVHFLW